MSTKRAQRRKSLKGKLVARFFVVTSLSYVLVASVVMLQLASISRRNTTETRMALIDGLVKEGLTLVRNNAVALESIALNSEFELMDVLVRRTVVEDSSIVHGMFMDPFRMVTVQVDEDHEHPTEPGAVLEDPGSIWAGEVDEPSYSTHMHHGVLHYEFVAPVTVQGVRMGTIRYGFDPSDTFERVRAADLRGRRSMLVGFLHIVVLYMVTLLVGYLVVNALAGRATAPISALVGAAERMTRGDHASPITVEADDEIGSLAEHIERARAEVHRHTVDLQSLIDEKMREVNDILENIDQGLFTVDLNGSISEARSSRTDSLFNVSDASGMHLAELLRFDPEQRKTLKLWLKLAFGKHARRWQKMAKLAPVHAVELPGDDGSSRYITLDYEPVNGPDGRLAKIMVLATDRTEQRRGEQELDEQRREHEHEVQTILAIADATSEEVALFVDTARATTLYVMGEVRHCHTGSGSNADCTDRAAKVMRKLHTLKGAAGTLGFEDIAADAHQVEDLIQHIQSLGPLERDEHLLACETLLERLFGKIRDLAEKHARVYGDAEHVAAKVPRELIGDITERVGRLDTASMTTEMRGLVDACRTLSWKPLGQLCRRYGMAVNRAARITGKDASLDPLDGDAFMPPDLFVGLDDIILHLVNNAVAHGIESTDERLAAGKGPGRVMLGVHLTDSAVTVTVADDGRGIDPEAIRRRARELELRSEESLAAMSDRDVRRLVFEPGFSTAAQVDELAGRGVGMDVVRERVTSFGGNITIDSEPGMGTAFEITLPRDTVLGDVAEPGDTDGTPEPRPGTKEHA